VQLTEVTYDVADGVATITLNRPERRNAFTGAMAEDLVAAAGAADADDAVRVVLVTGAGEAFCVGADLSGGADTFAGRRVERPPGPMNETIGGVLRDRGGIASLSFAALRKPVIAAFNGVAAGIGVTLTLPMDIRIAASSARFGVPFVRRGIAPEAASTWFLPRIVGISRAMEWVATGRIFDAEEALRGGLVSRVVPDGDLLPVAREIARDIVENTSGVAVAAARQLLWSMLGAPSPWDAHRAESRALAELGAGPDAAEGVVSFLEKRPPRFGTGLGPGAVAGVPRWPLPPDDLLPGE
jgi:enoyl-CoA hydratase/carnithine racemase